MANLSHRLRIADALLADGIVTEGQFVQALERQKSCGSPLSDILVELGAVTEEQVAAAVGIILGIPSIQLANYLIDPVVARLVPEKLARRHRLIAINRVGCKLTVAMADPIDILAIDEIQLYAGLTVKPVVATEREIAEASDAAYGQASPRGTLSEG